MTPVTRGRNDLWGGLIVAVGIVLAITAFAGVSLFQIGAVAFFTWLALTRKQGWAWLPAAFFGFHVAQDLLDGVGGSLFFPLLVVAGGVLMLSRDRLSKNATIGILLMLAVIGIASSNRGDDPTLNLRIDGPPRAAAQPNPPEQPDIPDDSHPYDLDGRQLVIQAGSTDLVLTRSRNAQVLIGVDSGFEIFEERGMARLEVPESDQPLEIALPAEADVLVRTVSGDVEAEVGAFKLDIDTISGNLDIELEGEHAITAESPKGRITAEGIDDFDPSPELLLGSADGTRLRLRSASGEILVSQT